MVIAVPNQLPWLGCGSQLCTPNHGSVAPATWQFNVRIVYTLSSLGRTHIPMTGVPHTPAGSRQVQRRGATPPPPPAPPFVHTCFHARALVYGLLHILYLSWLMLMCVLKQILNEYITVLCDQDCHVLKTISEMYTCCED